MLILNEISMLSLYSRGNYFKRPCILSEKLEQARIILVKYAQKGQTLTYREFALALGLSQPPVIKACTQILEAIMEEDVKNNHPILSAVVVQQGSAGIPRLGFYQCLNDLCDMSGIEAVQWHQQEMIKLKKHYISIK